MNFITSIKIKNFYSIKDEINVDFKATQYNIDNNKDRLFLFNDNYYNKVISFYGANASGKTSILKALVFLSNVINNEQTDNFPISFKNKFADITSQSEIEVTFIIELENSFNEFKYKINFKSDEFENIGINNESLFKITNKEEVIIFDRSQNIIENVANNIKKNIFADLNNSKSFFTEFEKFEETGIIKVTKKLFKYISATSNINIHKTQLGTNEEDELLIGKALKNTTENPIKNELTIFLLSFFNSIGLDIEKIEPKFNNEIENNNFIGIDIYHKIDDLEPLEFKFESDGTQMLMKILLDIFVMKHTDSILIIDELDSIIHPMLTPILINLLIKNDIQIIYSTHNIYNMKFLQNDEIFLIEKDTNHKTVIKAVKNNPNIKGFENLLTHYENGHLGGMPSIENIITKIF